MEITSAQIKELRDQTGISVMQCKKALEEAGGDMQKALVILKNAAAKPLKKSQIVHLVLVWWVRMHITLTK